MTASRLPSYPFEHAWSFAEQVKGWLTREEAELLYRLSAAADHHYEAISRDLRAWSPRIVQDGWVVFHDVGMWSGPTRAAADLLEAGFKRYAQSETALALCRLAARS